MSYRPLNLASLFVNKHQANIECCPRATTSSRDKYSGAKEKKRLFKTED